MTYRWSVLAVAAIVLGGSAWYFGRPTTPKEEPVPADYGLGPRAQIEIPHEPPPKVIEVIDLARAYEPIREPERPATGVDPASFIEERRAPGRIPMAKVFEEDEFMDVLIHIREADTGSFILGLGVESPTRINVMPREVNETETKPVRLDVMPREVQFILGSGIGSDAGITGELKLAPDTFRSKVPIPRD